MKTSELIEILKKIQKNYGDIDVLVLARDSGGDYNEYLPVESIDVREDIYDYLSKFYTKATII